MNWRGNTDFKDRLFSALAYTLPLFSAMSFGTFLFQQFPQLFPLLQIIRFLLFPISLVYRLVGSIIPFGFGSLVVFFILLLAVVRNYNIKHFIRFNTMQAILVEIALSLLGLILSPLVRQGILPNIIVFNLYNTIFLLVLGICFYSMFRSIQGRYPEIPVISEAVYSQVP